MDVLPTLTGRQSKYTLILFLSLQIPSMLLISPFYALFLLFAIDQLVSSVVPGQHHLGTCQKSESSGPTPDLRNQTLGDKVQQCVITPQVILMHPSSLRTVGQCYFCNYKEFLQNTKVYTSATSPSRALLKFLEIHGPLAYKLLNCRQLFPRFLDTTVKKCFDLDFIPSLLECSAFSDTEFQAYSSLLKSKQVAIP